MSLRLKLEIKQSWIADTSVRFLELALLPFSAFMHSARWCYCYRIIREGSNQLRSIAAQ